MKQKVKPHEEVARECGAHVGVSSVGVSSAPKHNYYVRHTFE